MITNALDVDDFMDRVQNDKELFFELLDIFVKDYHDKRKQLGEAIKNGDGETVEHVSHFLKGSCGNISATALRLIFQELEKKGNANDLEGLESYLPDIDRKFEQLTVFIGELRKKLL